MKKVFAMAMLALLLFNIGGYQLLFEYFIYQSDNYITDQINNNRYSSTDLVEVKIPVHLNIENWDGFKPIGGQVKVKDNVYNYAELKMTRDTMYLMCIPNHSKLNLIQANAIYGKQVNDIPSGKKSDVPLIKKNISESIYNYYPNRYQPIVSINGTKALHNYAFADIINISPDVNGQPPETINSTI